MVKLRKLVSTLCAFALLLSALLCSAAAADVRGTQRSAFAGQTIDCKIVDATTGEEQVVYLAIPTHATADEQQAIIDAAIKDALGIPTLFYDPDTTGAFPISKKYNLGISANASVSLGSGTLDGNMSISYCEFVNHNASSGTNVTVTFRNRTQSGISNVSANISGTRVTVFVTRLQDGFPMSSGDSISVTGVSNQDLYQQRLHFFHLTSVD